ncbi:MAG TPA: beta-galactosidase, partial [Anaerolineae bacterium]|nr:beta-galactosidase [Anaerolineae bacterium]
MDRRKSAVLFGFGAVLLVVAVLSAFQLSARQRYLTRGWETGAPSPFPDTSYPPLCVNAALEQYDPQRLEWALDLAAEGGFTWVRQRFPWSEIEPEPGRFEWAPWDAMVAGAVERGLQLLPVLTSPPAWAGMPPDPEAFARFAAALANHYSAQLVYYQIWHNPNLGETWGGKADPLVYADLLAHAAPAIRAADPDARIVLGGLAPTVEDGPVNYNEPRFLELLVAAGASPYYDVVAAQPLGFSTGPEDRDVALTRLNFSRAVLLRETLVALGEGDKALWATLMGWNSLPADWPGPVSIWGQVDPQTQAGYTTAALARAESEWPWMGVMCINALQPRPADPTRAVPDAEEHWGFALIGPDGEPRPLYTALQAWAARPRVAHAGVYPASSPLITYTGGWRLGPLGADIPLNASAEAGNARATFTF